MAEFWYNIAKAGLDFKRSLKKKNLTFYTDTIVLQEDFLLGLHSR